MDKTQIAPHEHENIDATAMRELDIYEVDAVAGGYTWLFLRMPSALLDSLRSRKWNAGC